MSYQENLMDPCGPFVSDYIEGDVERNILPEDENFTSYWNRSDCPKTSRPGREKVREEISDYVLLMLGAPTIRVELDTQQLTLCVDEALKKFEENAPREYFRYYKFNTIPNVSKYQLPCFVGWIRAVSYLTRASHCGHRELGGVYSFASPMGQYGGVSWGGYMPAYPFWGNMGEWALFKGYLEVFNRYTSNEGAWQITDDNTLHLYPNPIRELPVIVEYIERQNEWTYIESWIKEYALAMAKQIVGRIRSKYDRFVSPGGGVTLDGQRLLDEGTNEKRELEQLLIDRYSISHMIPVVG